MSKQINSLLKAAGNYYDMKRLMGSCMDAVGVLDGEYAYKGPHCVQIDLTNDCNNNCIACWCNSPLLGDKAISHSMKKQTLDYGVVTGLIDKLHEIGTTELYFSGGGEPFMHPRALDILSHSKKKGFTCYVNTNFTLLNEDMLDKLKKIGLDHLVVSLWAATPATYAATHPNKNEDTFLRIKALLEWLNRTKHFLPKIRLYNVICNVNYREFIRMIEFCPMPGDA